MAKITIEVDDRTLDWLEVRAARDKASVEQVAAKKLQDLRPRQWKRPSEEDLARLPAGLGEFRSKSDSDEEELLLVLTHKTVKRIRSWARKIGKSEEEVVRQLVEIYFAQERNSLPAGMGEFHSGDATIAQRSEEILEQAVESGEWP
jgi:hypothetical protein